MGDRPNSIAASAFDISSNVCQLPLRQSAADARMDVRFIFLTKEVSTMPDDFDLSVTAWVGRLKQGEDEAAAEIWHRYFDRLVHVARRKMGAAPRREVDEEDIARARCTAFVEEQRRAG